MATRTSDIKRDFDASVDPCFEEWGVVASDIIYEGSAVGIQATGYAAPAAVAAMFAGFCAEKVDNSAGAANAKRVKVRTQGKVKLPVTGVTAITNRGAAVYLGDDDTFSLTSTSKKLIGKIVRHISSTTCLVYFSADFLDPSRAVV
jgi:hypothetical protein